MWASIANTAETKSVTDSLIPMGENGFLENGVFNSMQFINDFNKLLGTFSVLPNLEQLSKIGTSELGNIIASNSNQFTISVPVTIQGNADTSTVNLIKNTMDEQMQNTCTKYSKLYYSEHIQIKFPFVDIKNKLLV